MRGKYQLPELEAMNLYLVHNAGSGNCLFHALSDQLHGDESKFVQYRADTIAYMRAHPARFKPFLPANPGGGFRRNPKRKNPGALVKPVNTRSPSHEEIETNFQSHLKNMEKGGAYGDNMEIVAFANAYKVNVNLYSEEAKKFIPIECDDKSGEQVKDLFVVLHTWEHFASIRNKSGPHTGPANVTCDHPSLQKDTSRKDVLTSRSYAQTWMVDRIKEALPYLASREIIIEALEVYQGNMTRAVSALMPASSSSSSRSSSIERDISPEDEIDVKPKKKLDRRASRPQPLRFAKTNKNVTTDPSDSNSTSPDPAQLSAALSKLSGDDSEDPDATDEEDWHILTPFAFADSETTSVSTSTSDASTASKGSKGSNFRLKLSQPKPPAGRARSNPTDCSEQSVGGDSDLDNVKSRFSRGIGRPRRRLITGKQKEMEEHAKEASKAARRASLSPMSANSKQSRPSPPVIDDKIKILSL